MSLGVLGGTFDPIHLGHLRAAERAREALGLERVLLVPAAQPPHRSGPRGGALDRWAMVALAAAGRPDLVPSDLELARGGTSYTVDTLLALRERDPGEALVLILGSDALADLPGWRQVERVFALARVAVVGRPGASAEPGPLPGPLERVPSSGMDVSASAIRARLGAGGRVDGLVPPAVAEYIAKRGLYA